MRIFALIASVVLALLAGPAVAQPVAARVALIIANGKYYYANELPNPPKDATIIEKALKAAGFDTGVVQLNRTKAQIETELLAFRKKADKADVALIYFAGHGMRVGSTNWLLPVDFDDGAIANDDDFESVAVSHRTMLRQLGAAKTRIAIFDACRDNPFEQSLAARMELASRAVTVGTRRTAPVLAPGLAPIEIDDVLVLFSAAAGKFASDGVAGQTSPFARAFADEFVREGVEIRLMAAHIRDRVVALTGGDRSATAQRPYMSTSLKGDEIYLMGAPLRAGPIGEEAAAFEKCNKDWSVPCWSGFVTKYPGGTNIRTAQLVLASLGTPRPPTASSEDIVKASTLLANMTVGEWSKGDVNVLRARLIATIGRTTLDQLVALNDPRAQWIVGGAYAFGLNGYPTDDIKANGLFEASARAGFGPGQASFGYILDEGTGGRAANKTEAVRLYRLAADQGYAIGQSNLGFMYENGKGGLTADDREAVRLYRLAADQGYAIAQASLGFMYENGKGGLIADDREAVRLYRLAAGQGNAGAQVNLGFMYENGKGGLIADDREAVRLYRLAAAQGYAAAQYNLGVMYGNGKVGLIADDREAVRLYRLAAAQGYAAAQYNLGLMYENGKGGLSQDKDEAVRLYRLAAAQGLGFAKDRLATLGIDR